MKFTPTTEGQLISYNNEKEKNVMDFSIEVGLPWDGLQPWFGETCQYFLESNSSMTICFEAIKVKTFLIL